MRESIRDENSRETNNLILVVILVLTFMKLVLEML